jgi:outer membrane protein OmpA-like peptidoglycan-associated protein
VAPTADVGDADALQEQLDALGRITFRKGSNTLTPAGREVVRRAAAVLREERDLHVRLEGYTDDDGTTLVNRGLSYARARTVRLTLQHLGVPAERLSSVGYGERRPVVPNTTPSNRMLNRRVEFRVIAS